MIVISKSLLLEALKLKFVTNVNIRDIFKFSDNNTFNITCAIFVTFDPVTFSQDRLTNQLPKIETKISQKHQCKFWISKVINN